VELCKEIISTYKQSKRSLIFCLVTKSAALTADTKVVSFLAFAVTYTILFIDCAIALTNCNVTATNNAAYLISLKKILNLNRII